LVEAAYREDEENMLALLEKNQSVLAPEFDGVDTDGKRVKLSTYREKSNVVLVLNRGFG
jgi:hypothetical protein